MKKSLIALAVMGASGFAMAQSSVTLYGVADVAVGQIESYKTTKDKAQMYGGNTYINNGPSRIGLRGVEDLGGGLKAGFQFETGVNMEDGMMNSAGGTFWGRAANVFVGGNWGTVKLGRQLTPSHLATANYELTGTALYSVVGNAYNYAGIGARASSAFAYVTPNMGGLTAALAYVSKNDTGLAKDVYDLGLMYNNGPLAAGLSFNKVAGGKEQGQLGAKFNMGNFALAASYHHTNGVAGHGAETVRRGASIGAAFNAGPFGLVVDVTRDTKRASGSVNLKKYTNGLVEAKYALSKRTFFYGQFNRFDDKDNYGIGLRHNF